MLNVSTPTAATNVFATKVSKEMVSTASPSTNALLAFTHVPPMLSVKTLTTPPTSFAPVNPVTLAMAMSAKNQMNVSLVCTTVTSLLLVPTLLVVTCAHATSDIKETVKNAQMWTNAPTTLATAIQLGLSVTTPMAVTSAAAKKASLAQASIVTTSTSVTWIHSMNATSTLPVVTVSAPTPAHATKVI